MTALIIVIIVIAALILIPIIFLTAITLPIKTDREYENDSRFYRSVLYISSLITLKFAGVKLKITGMDKIPEKGRFLLVGNHRSNFDPIVQWTILRKRDTVAFVSKGENFNIPWFGRIIRRCCFMAIDRENPRNAMKTFHKAARLIKEDKFSIGIYPEGTRSRTNELLPFHNGVFRIAQEAKVPIIIVAVKGTEMVRKNFPLRPTTISVDFVDIIPAETVTELKHAEIGEVVRQALLNALK